METRSNKRKRALMANPYQRTFIPRVRTRTNPSTKNRVSVNNLRSRRVFSPSSISDVNGSSEEAEKEGNFGDENRGKSDLGFRDENGGSVGIEVEGKIGMYESEGKSDLGFEGGAIEIGVFSDLGQLNQEMVLCQEDTPMDGNVKEKDSSVHVGEGDEQIKSKVHRLGAPLVPCSRKKVYKNPSSFSYRRMLPYLTNLAKDNLNSLELHPCQKVQKSSGERPIPSLSAPQDIPIDGTNKEVFTVGHPFGGLNIDPNPSNAECSNMISPEHQITEPIILETHKTPILPTADPLHKDLLHTFDEVVSQSRENKPERSIKSHDVSCTVHETNLPVKSSLSLSTPQSLNVKVVTENAKLGEKNGGKAVVENYENEQIQSTPPDRDIFCKPVPGTGKNGLLECQLSNASDHDKKRLAGDITLSNSRAKLGTLTSSSRMKLYRTPGSFSYRRLLPYLMDLAKHDTNALVTQPCKIIDNIIYEESSSLPVSQEMLEDGPVPETLPILESTETNPLASSECINLGSNEDNPVPEVSAHKDVESLSQIEKQPMNESIYTEPIQTETNLLIKSPPSLAIPELEMNSPEELSITQEPSSSGLLYSPKETMSTPSPGILKRYPRGCRGICTCLKCTSFRLNAERAFEFSRNQMEDSQEIAMELVRELSSIRALLEKSANGADCHILLPVSKVKEACMKASRAEELAKSHLKEMNQELNFHCRTPGVPRPRVRFAEKSQMQLTMEEDSQANSSVN